MKSSVRRPNDISVASKRHSFALTSDQNGVYQSASKGSSSTALSDPWPRMLAQSRSSDESEKQSQEKHVGSKRSQSAELYAFVKGTDSEVARSSLIGQAGGFPCHDPDSEVGIAISKSRDRASAIAPIARHKNSSKDGSSRGSGSLGRLSSAVLSLAHRMRSAGASSEQISHSRQSSGSLVLEWSDNWKRKDESYVLEDTANHSAKVKISKVMQHTSDSEDALSTTSKAISLMGPGSNSALISNEICREYAATNAMSRSVAPLPCEGDTGEDAISTGQHSYQRFHRHKKIKLLLEAVDLNGSAGRESLIPKCMLVEGYHDITDVEFEVRHRLRCDSGLAPDDTRERQLDAIIALDHQQPQPSQMDDNSSNVLRIEKLFPNDDLDLAASQSKQAQAKAARKWQSTVASSHLLKPFRKSQSLSSPLAESFVNQNDYVTRKFLLESSVQLTVGLQTQERYLFLFNDLLFIAKHRPGATGYKLKRRVPVAEIWIAEAIQDVSEASHCDPSRSFVIGWPITNLVATFTTADTMQQWKDKLLIQMAEEKSKESFSVVTEVLYKEGVTAPRALSLIVSRSDGTIDLTRKALNAFGIDESCLNFHSYQLWVVSSRENSPYPLFGHEEPFAIHMSHKREAARSPDSNVKCQFILKEKKKPERIDRKQLKTKKKLDLAVLFRRSTSKLLASPPLPSVPSKSSAHKKLFGHPLTKVCQDGLPAPLKKLLENLYNLAPFTCEIFRKPSNARECHEMAVKMDSDDPTCWQDRKNGLLYASVLKTFLRELPNRLLHYELYSAWAETTAVHDRSKRIARCKSLMLVLDSNELELLKCIICILHHVQRRSHRNRMNSYNLSVCLGPSLLWPAVSSEHDLGEASRLVPDVVQFLLDNCTEIFGDDLLRSTFEHPPMSHPDEEDSDEREAEQNLQTPYSESLESISDTGTPRTLQQMSPSSRSRDSGLILNDARDEEDQSDENLTKYGRSMSCCDGGVASIKLDKSRSHGSLAPSDASADIVSAARVSSNRTNLAARTRRPNSLDVRMLSEGQTNDLSSVDSETACERPIGELLQSLPGRRSVTMLTKSSSGGHLCFDASATNADSREGTELKVKLRALAEQCGAYAESAPSLLLHRECSGLISSSSTSSPSSDEMSAEESDDEGNGTNANCSALSASHPVGATLFSLDSEKLTSKRASLPIRICGRTLQSMSDGEQCDNDSTRKSVSKTMRAMNPVWQLSGTKPADLSSDSSKNHCSATDIAHFSSSTSSISRQKSSGGSVNPLGLTSAAGALPMVEQVDLDGSSHFQGAGSQLADFRNVSAVSRHRPLKSSVSAQSSLSQRPKQPPSYQEALERTELNRAGITEIERIKQTVMSARAKQLYAKSVQMFETEQQSGQQVEHEGHSLMSSSSSSSTGDEASCVRLLASPTDSKKFSDPLGRRDQQAVVPSSGVGCAAVNGIQPRSLDSTVVTTKEKTIIIRRGPPIRNLGESMFYQPGHEPSRASSGAVFYRPPHPPSYNEALTHQHKGDRKQRALLYDDSVSESLV